MSTLSKSSIDPIASVKSIIQGCFVEWSIDNSSTNWEQFIDNNIEGLGGPLRLALGHLGMASTQALEFTSHTEGVMKLLVQLDIISGYEKAIKDRLTLIQKTREHEVALATENAKLSGWFLQAETRLKLGKNIDTSVSILTTELADLREQYTADAEICRNAAKRLREIELSEEFMMLSTESFTPDSDGNLLEIVGEYLALKRRIYDSNSRKGTAITRTLELTTQLQMSVGTLDQLSGYLTGLVDATYNYANPETADEFTETTTAPYLEADVSDGGSPLKINGV
jgi:hypothetical protein